MGFFVLQDVSKQMFFLAIRLTALRFGVRRTIQFSFFCDVSIESMQAIPGRFRQWISRLREEPIVYDTTPYAPLLAEIRGLEDSLRLESDVSLQERGRSLRRVASEGAALDGLLVEAFALVREVADRCVGLRPYDTQMLAGIAMHEGKIAEMQTGEGKTLAAVMPAFLRALQGMGVHILTFNDYLARRDAQWMGKIYAFLGISVGCIQKEMTPAERQAAWAADVTYATAKEAGFDFLRDQLAQTSNQLVHRPFSFAIVDEADSILIDEARIPLVIAGGRRDARAEPHQLAALVKELVLERHVQTDEFQRLVYLTEEGFAYLEERLGCGALHAPENRTLLAGIHVALHALILLHKDVDYIVRNGKVELVDEWTGRVVEDRQWPDGIQAALEAKEGLDLQAEGQILGSIALQHLMRQYRQIAGMTGTARPAEAEFFGFYGASVVVIPTHRPCVRVDESDRLYVTKEAKHNAILQAIQSCQKQGRPVLVGTCSVEESESLSRKLQVLGIVHQVLNARTDEREAEMIAQAGLVAAVTISTNMAGRGVDIKLGGADEATRDAVVQAGGLYVIGTNRHESVRIDDQLRGRAGRQGDPGSSVFFVSLEDDLMQRFRVIDSIPKRLLPTQQDEALDNPALLRAVERTQRIVEGQNYTIRQTLFRYSSFVENQRATLHDYRKALLLGKEDGCGALNKAEPVLYARILEEVGEFALQVMIRDVTLFHLDACWAEHLARLADIRESIHLQSAAGRDPFVVFCQQAIAAYETVEDEIPRRVVETFRSSRWEEGRFVLDRSGMERPSSTWTYLIHDEVFEQGLTAMFRSAGAAFSAGGFFLLIPLAVGWAIWRKVVARRAKQSR